MALLPALAPGSLPWLLRHQMRILWRSMGQGRRGAQRRAAGRSVGGMVFLVVLAVAWAAFSGWLGWELGGAMSARGKGIPADATPWITLAILFAFSTLLVQALLLTLRSFYERGDLDLLLMAPIPPPRVFAAKTLGVAAVLPLLYLGLVGPFAVGMAVGGKPSVLMVLPLLLALGLLAAGAARGLAALLVRWLGVRRARTAAQIVAGILGAGVFLLTQLPTLLGDEGGDRAARQRFWETLPHVYAGWPGWAQAAAGWPGGVLLGDPFPLLVIALLGLAATWAAVQAGGSAAPSNGPPRRARLPDRVRFGGGLRQTVVTKELRLVMRNRELVFSLVLRTLYLIPAIVLLLRGEALLAGAATSIAVIGTSLMSSLAWIVVSAEDAPDLVGTAPVARATLVDAKLVAAAVPVAALSVVPLALITAQAPLVGLAGAASLALGCWMTGRIAAWYARPIPRDLVAKGQGMPALVMIGDYLLIGMLGFIAFALASGSPLVALPAIIYGAVASGMHAAHRPRPGTAHARPWRERLRVRWPGQPRLRLAR